jgi:hypothetical protein
MRGIGKMNNNGKRKVTNAFFKKSLYFETAAPAYLKNLSM